MRKTLLIVFLLITVLLAACQSSAPTEGITATEQVANTQPPTAMTEPTEAATEQAAPTLEQVAAEGSLVRMTCTVESRDPTPGPTEASIFPPISESDWVQGPDTAKVTIIEYSDFQ